MFDWKIVTVCLVVSLLVGFVLRFLLEVYSAVAFGHMLDRQFMTMLGLTIHGVVFWNARKFLKNKQRV